MLSTAIYSQTSEIKFIDTFITIDGNFNESVWDNLPESTDFYNYLPTDIGLAENQTSVKLFHNGEYLYVSATYFDSTQKTVVSTFKKRYIYFFK